MSVRQRKLFDAINRRLPHYFELRKTRRRWVDLFGSFYVVDVRRNYLIDVFIEDLEGYHDSLRW